MTGSNAAPKGPASFAQEELWAARQLKAKIAAYNMPYAAIFEGPISLTSLHSAIEMLQQRHAILRTRLVVEEGRLLQVVENHLKFFATTVDLTHLASANATEGAARLCIQQAREPFIDEGMALFRQTTILLPNNTTGLVFVFDHAIMDAVSVALFFRELEEAYREIATGHTYSSPAPGADYLEFSSWLAAKVASKEGQDGLQYWTETLRGMSFRVGINSPSIVDNDSSLRGKRISSVLPAVTVENVKRLARELKATVFVVTLSAFLLALRRFMRQEDITIGFPTTQRVEGRFETTMGNCVNLAPLRAVIELNRSFADLVTQVRGRILDALSHGFIPVSHIIRRLDGLAASSDGQINVVFSMDTEEAKACRLGQCSSTFAEIYNETAKFPLAMHASLRGDIITLTLEYDCLVFGKDHARAFQGEFNRVLFGLQSGSATKCGLVGHGVATELPDVAVDDVENTCCASSSNTLSDAFDVIVQRFPDRIGVRFGRAQISYQQLHQRAEMIANNLRRIGVCAGDFVAILMDRSLNVPAAVLGILKVGASYVPIEVSAPRERIVAILTDSRCRVVVVDNSTVANGGQCGCSVVNVDELDRASGTVGGYKVSSIPEQIAYVIYTSGSTGVPKGVAVPHANVITLLESCKKRFDFRPNDRWTMFHSLAFDFSVWEMWGALLTGGTLVIVAPAIARSPDDFITLLVEEKITVLNQTPSAFQQLATALLHRIGPEKLCLRYLVFGGEALQFEDLGGRALERHGCSPVYVNMYGITETTVHATFRKVEESDYREQRSLIGTGLPGVRVQVLSEDWEEAVPGQIGEIFVSGRLVSYGYLDRAALTAERFLPYPAAFGCRMYRSGDLGRYLSESEIEYFGRGDSQVKVRGHRVELGEVRSVLARHRHVRNVAVVLHNVGEVVAFVEIDDEQYSERELRGFVASKLPPQYVPTRIVSISRLPVTVNGKLDVRTLRHTELGSRLEEPIHPAATLQERILHLCRKVLRVDSVETSDSFFGIGGDSIRAVLLTYECRQRGIRINVEDVLQSNDLRELACRAQEKASCFEADVRGPSNPESPGEDAIDLPLSDMQEVMVREYECDFNRCGVYHSQQLLELTSDAPISVERLVAAVYSVSRRHPALKTVIGASASGEKRQQVIWDKEPDVKVLAGAGHDASALFDLDRLIPFDTRNFGSLLWRATVLRLSEKALYLFIAAHHAIEDGWGNIVLQQELLDAYRQPSQPNTTPALDRKANVVAEFIKEQKTVSANPSYRAFWNSRRREWKGANSLQLARTQPRKLGRISFSVDTRTVKALRRAQGSVRVTEKAIYLAALAGAACTVFDTEKLLMGVVSNGRTMALSDPLGALGLFWTMVPHCAHARQDKLQLLRETHEALISYDLYAAYPVQQLLTGLAPISVTFNFVNFHHSKELTQDSTLTIRCLRSEDSFHYPVNMFVSASPLSERPWVLCSYDTRYMDDQCASGLVAEFGRWLVELLAKISVEPGGVRT